MAMEMETATATNDKPKIEVKSARDIRVALADLDVPHYLLAETIGAGQFHLSGILHERRPLTALMRIRIEQGLEKLAENAPAIRQPPVPRVRRL